MTKHEFIKLLKTATIETTFDSELRPYCSSSDEYISDEYVSGWVFNVLTCPGFECYLEMYYNHPIGKPARFFDSWIDEDFLITSCSFDVIDENEEALDDYEIEKIVFAHTDIEIVDRSILGSVEINPHEFTGTDIPEGYELITLECTNSADQVICAKQIEYDSDHEPYVTHRWFEFTIYELVDGSYACHKVLKTYYYGERDKMHVEYDDSLYALINELPDSYAANRIFNRLD